QPYTHVLDMVKQLGYNTIRLPFSNELVETNPIVTTGVAANPQFRGVHALDVMDAIVRYCQRIGLKVILDDHRSVASRRHNVNWLLEPLWYVPGYPESSWVQDWVTLARRYIHNDAVIGFDLRNEPHTNGPGPWNVNAYLHQGATWGPYNGVDDLSTDWRLAAERAGNAVLAVNPHLLMFVEGLQLYPDPSQPNGVNSYWWGSILTPARNYPIQFDVPHQLVYSAHDWGPWKWEMPWFHNMTYASLQQVWERNWSFLLDPSNPNAAPLWIGEFGTCTLNPGCVTRERQGNQAQWFNLFLRFLQDHPELGWSFFALNGTNSNDHTANNGLLNARWTGVQNPALQKELETIQP
ncbi:MAG TPA: glycoside hydrolase family 5 protein, partial [Chloroflexota bacterium]